MPLCWPKTLNPKLRDDIKEYQLEEESNDELEIQNNPKEDTYSMIKTEFDNIEELEK